MLIVETNSSTLKNEILIDPTFNVHFVDPSGFRVDSDAFDAAQKLLRLFNEKSSNVEQHGYTGNDITDDDNGSSGSSGNSGNSGGSRDTEDEDYLTGPSDHFFDDTPKFQPPFFGHLDDFSSLSALLRFHRQQHRTFKKNLVAQLAANATVVTSPVMSTSPGMIRNHRRHRRYKMVTKRCDDRLGTYFRVDEPATVLQVLGLKNRLVISLPESKHDLRTTRFFLAIRGALNATSVRLEKRDADGEAGTSFGSIYFRQDQLHIDLFVFFSVFFSCFFLFLSVCVLVWKVKAVSDLRRARRRHAVEMQSMARRPFASQSVAIDNNGDEAFSTENFRHLLKVSKVDFAGGVGGIRKSLHQHQRLLLHSNAVRDLGSSRAGHDATDDSSPMTILPRPLAFEQTSDGLAAVSTFLVQMPNCAALEKANGQSLISFGCVLVSTNSTSSMKSTHPNLPQKSSRRRNLSSDGSTGPDG